MDLIDLQDPQGLQVQQVLLVPLLPQDPQVHHLVRMDHPQDLLRVPHLVKMDLQDP